MAPLIVLTVVFFVLLLVGRERWRPVTSLRAALAAMFLLTAWAHFSSMRADLVRMVPPAFPEPELLVTLTGIAELAGAIGLLIPRTVPWAAGSLAVLLIAMFPANVYAALHGVSLGGRPATPLALRTALQLLFIGALIVAAIPDRIASLWRKTRARPLSLPRRLGTDRRS